jgi:hypothetical protein
VILGVEVVMARYLEVAAEANVVAQRLLELVPEAQQPQAAELIARLVNFGIRCSPRAVQSTVRFNAVQRAVRGLPVKVRMEQKTDERSGRTYNALITSPVVKEGEVVREIETVEGAVEE